MIDAENDFDVAALALIKALYEATEYNKNEVRRLLHPNVVEAVNRPTGVFYLFDKPPYFGLR